MNLEQQPASGELLGMSDEDFANLNGPPETGAVVEDKEEDKTTEAAPAQEPVEAIEPEDKGEAEAKDPVDPPVVEDKAVEAGPTKATEAKAEDKTKDQEAKPEASVTGSNAGVVADVTDEAAQAFYKQVMAPFKANGKMIELKDPKEVIQLMQMGANYTRKLQDIQPHRKMLLMLQNNDLLDEGKLSFLIDLDKRNPEAIKKLIKDAGIDPMDIDTSVEPAYSEGNHQVSDEEAGFRQVLDEVASTQTGKETLQIINTEWDQASKEALWQSPEIMTVIHEQRENGVFDTITTEMNRQKTLGLIPPNTPFLQAYKTVGDELAAAGAFGSPKVAEPVVVATTTGATKSTVANGDKASAASPTRTSTRKAEKLVNPLAMSDEEFLQLGNLSDRL